MTNDQLQELFKVIKKGNENIVKELQNLNKSLIEVTETINEANIKLQKFETR